MHEGAPFKNLPGSLKIVWGILVLGLILAAAGYYNNNLQQSYAGSAFFIGGYLLAIVDMLFRKRDRNRAAPFHAGVIIAPVFGLFLSLIFALIGTIVLLFFTFTDDLSEAKVLRMIHFLAIIYAFLITTGILTVAKCAQPEEQEPVTNRQGNGS